MGSKGEKLEFAVIGLGLFGANLALTLIERGYNVLGIDIDRGLVQQYADELTHTVALDSADEEALRAVDITAFDTVIVAIGTDFESNLMTTVALKSLGVRRVICKALTDRQGDILLKVGADRVILPEREAGQRLAIELTDPQILGHMVLGPGHTIIEVQTPRSLIGQTLTRARLFERFGVNLLVIKTGDSMIVAPPADTILHENDIMVVVGVNEAVERLVRQN